MLSWLIVLKRGKRCCLLDSAIDEVDVEAVDGLVLNITKSGLEGVGLRP